MLLILEFLNLFHVVKWAYANDLPRLWLQRLLYAYRQMYVLCMYVPSDIEHYISQYIGCETCVRVLSMHSIWYWIFSPWIMQKFFVYASYLGFCPLRFGDVFAVCPSSIERKWCKIYTCLCWRSQRAEGSRQQVQQFLLSAKRLAVSLTRIYNWGRGWGISIGSLRMPRASCFVRYVLQVLKVLDSS